MISRTEIARAIDRVRDHLLIAKNAVEEDDIEKAEEAIALAVREVAALAEDLRAA